MMALHNLLQMECRTGWRLWGLWSLALLMLVVLGIVQAFTEAEFALASAALLPVLAISWFCGRTPGLMIASLATVLCLTVDYASGQHLYAAWVPWANAAIRLLVYGLIAQVAAHLRVQFDRERERAIRDPLTGLRNRRGFIEAGQRETERSRKGQHSMGVIFLDLDHFKQLNDTQGHRTGDRALQETARVLVAHLRSTDCVARLSSDEFAILLPAVSWEIALQTAFKATDALRPLLAHFPPVSTSLGLAWFASVDRPFPAMLEAAEELLYQAKKLGSGSVRAQRFDGTQPADPPGRSGTCHAE